MIRYRHISHEMNFPNFVLVRITKIRTKAFPPQNITKASNRYHLTTMHSNSVKQINKEEPGYNDNGLYETPYKQHVLCYELIPHR